MANADTPRRRVGVMGGTFDPIHHGHLVAASEVQAWFDLDEVVFVPAGEPWQKFDRQVSAADTIRACFCHGSPVGTNTTSSRSNQAWTSLAATR